MFIYNETKMTSDVLTCIERNGQFLVTLDRTCFYANSGGQPSDEGFINNLQVLEVYKYGGENIHVLNEEVSGSVELTINSEVRHRNSTLHTSQHVVSALFDKLQSTTSSFNIKGNMFSIDLSLEHSQRELDQIEMQANLLLSQDIVVSEDSYDELKDSEIELPGVDKQDIRIIDIAGLDRNPCGGTHLGNLNEVKIIKFVKSKTSRGGTRLWVTAGDDALKFIQEKYNNYRELISTLGVEEERAVSFLENRLISFKSYKKQLKYIKKNSEFDIEL